jgi:hypothetical protein
VPLAYTEERLKQTRNKSHSGEKSNANNSSLLVRAREEQPLRER